MPSRGATIIKTLYAPELEAPRPGALKRLLSPRLARNERILAAQLKRKARMRLAMQLAMVAAVAVAFALLASSAVYYNKLTILTQNIEMEVALIDAIAQRRRHIQINLARTLRDYAEHERAIFKHVADARTLLAAASPGLAQASGAAEASAPNPESSTGSPTPGSISGPSAPATAAESIPTKPPPGPLEKVLAALEGPAGAAGAAGPGGVEAKLGRLLGVAENYPDLKLSENFRILMNAVIATEKDQNEEIAKYSVQVNAYTTLLKTVPGRWFAWIFCFKPIPYLPIAEEIRRFNPVDY